MFEFFYNFAGQNQKLFLLINHATNVNMVPQILRCISWFFSIGNVAIYYSILCLYCYWQIKKVAEFKRRYQTFCTIYHKMIKIAITYCSFGVIYAGLKFGINLPRPFCSLAHGSFYSIANLEVIRCLSSFPSAHTGLALLIAYFLMPYLKLRDKIIACFLIMVVATSRITLAVHYPADIFYSLFITGFVIIIGNFIYVLLKNNLIKFMQDILAKFII